MTRRVLQYARTAQGQWYPAKLEEQHTWEGKGWADKVATDRSESQTIEILLDTTEPIADELFDPDRVDPAILRPR